MNCLWDWEDKYKKIVNRESKQLCKRTISIEEKAVVAQPGMAADVKNLIAIITKIDSIEMPIIMIEKISRRVAIVSMKTPIAPNPCKTKEEKFILDPPVYRLPLWV